MLCSWCRRTILFVLVACLMSLAQGTLEDYQRAQHFLPGDLRYSIYVADVSAHWVGKTNRFWYHKVSPKGSEFILVDADHNTVAPAFEQFKVTVDHLSAAWSSRATNAK